MPRSLLTINETAREFNLSAFTVRTLVKTGAIPAIQVGNRLYISREVFARYLEHGGEKHAQ
ncbi:hypothetical protein FACS1894184_16640 [Clostridia bacterium]|nr:hypothetical protein FACS1894184_16640 [Clostridia bacterium]